MLQQLGIASRLLPTQAAGHATALARAVEGVSCVACYGGDGTLNETAAGLLGRGIPLAFLPGGTANVMAWELGLGRDPVVAAHTLATGRVLPIRPGVVEGRPFLLMAGFGFDADAVYRVRPALKQRLGKGAYVVAGLAALLAPMPHLTVRTDEGSIRQGSWAVAARAGHYGGSFWMHRVAALTADALGTVVVRRRWLLPFLFAGLGLGLPFSTRAMWRQGSRSFVVEADQPFHAQVDGDYFGKATRFIVSLSDKTLPLRVPGSYVGTLHGAERLARAGV